jgi:hypothetical protein
MRGESRNQEPLPSHGTKLAAPYGEPPSLQSGDYSLGLLPWYSSSLFQTVRQSYCYYMAVSSTQAKKYLPFATIPAHIKNACARVAIPVPSIYGLHPAPARSPLGRAIFDPLPFGLRLQHILSSDASKFVKEEYPIHKTLKQTKTNKPKRK